MTPPEMCLYMFTSHPNQIGLQTNRRRSDHTVAKLLLGRLYAATHHSICRKNHTYCSGTYILIHRLSAIPPITQFYFRSYRSWCVLHMWKLSISAANSHFKWRKNRSKNRYTFQLAQIHHFQKINFDAEIFAFWLSLYILCWSFCDSLFPQNSRKKILKNPKIRKCSPLYGQSGFDWLSLVFML